MLRAILFALGKASREQSQPIFVERAEKIVEDEMKIRDKILKNFIKPS